MLLALTRLLTLFLLRAALLGEGERGLASFDPECLRLGSEALLVLGLGSGLAAYDAFVGSLCNKD